MDHTARLRPGFFGTAMKRRWRIVVAGALLSLVAGLVALSQLPVTYTSHASLILNPLVGNPYAPDLGTGRVDQLAALQTEAALVDTLDVSELARVRSAQALPAMPQNNLSAVVESNTQVLELSFTGSSSADARAGAQAFAEAYLEYRANRAAQANADAADRLREQLDRTAAVLADTNSAIAAAAPGSATERQLQGQLAVFADNQAQLTLALAEATGAVPSAGRIISPASAASLPSGLPAWLILAGALLAGTGLAVVIGLAREHSDERLHDSDELTAIGVGHPLAAISIGSGAFDLDRPAPPGYRLLLTGLVARAGVEAPVACVVGINRTIAAEVAGGLAATTYRLGRAAMVVGVEAPARWRAARILPAHAIIDASGLVTPTHQEAASLVVVPLDIEADSGEEIVLSPALPRFVTAARKSGSLVFLAGGTSGSAAGQTLASIADLTLVVVELGRDTFPEVIEVVETLQEVGVTHIGLVVATPNRTRALFSRASPQSGQSQPRAQVDKVVYPATSSVVRPAVDHVVTANEPTSR